MNLETLDMILEGFDKDELNDEFDQTYFNDCINAAKEVQEFGHSTLALNYVDDACSVLSQQSPVRSRLKQFIQTSKLH